MVFFCINGTEEFVSFYYKVKLIIYGLLRSKQKLNIKTFMLVPGISLTDFRNVSGFLTKSQFYMIQFVQ